MNPEMFGASKRCPPTGFLRHKAQARPSWNIPLDALEEFGDVLVADLSLSTLKGQNAH
jgi:hypothetical protein